MRLHVKLAFFGKNDIELHIIQEIDVQKDINFAALEDIGRRLGTSRNRKGISQRALADQIRSTQAHISKIEQGRVDLRFSSLVELARALDLDVQLLPRQVRNAVESVVRSAESDEAEPRESRAIATIAQQAAAVESIRSAHPHLDAAHALSETLRDLPLPRYDAETLKAIGRALEPAVRASTAVAASLDDGKLARLLERVDRHLRTVRNREAHFPHAAEREVQRPAYRLDDDDD